MPLNIDTIRATAETAAREAAGLMDSADPRVQDVASTVEDLADAVRDLSVIVGNIERHLNVRR